MCWNCSTKMPAEIARILSDIDAEVEKQENIDEQADIEKQTAQPAVPKVASSMGSGLPWSVLVFGFFPPVGLVALIYSVLAEIARIHSRRDLALDYSRRAASWQIITIGAC